MADRRVPPNDVDAEQAVLSSAMLSQRALDELSTSQVQLERDHFYDPRHRIVWGAVVEARDARQPVDTVTIAGRLRDQGRLEQAGGAAYLAQLVDATPAVAHVIDHAKRVLDTWRKRRLLELFRTAEAECYDVGSGHDLDKWCNELGAELDAIGTSCDRERTIFTARELAQMEHQAMRERVALGRPSMGIPTGLTQLDQQIGGLRRGRKYIVAGRPGSGKTGFLCTVALNVAAIGFGVVMISVEMPKEDMTQRCIAQLSHLDITDIERGTLRGGDWDAFTKGTQSFANLPIAVDESGEQSVRSIRAAVRKAMRQLREEHPERKLGLIVIDYIQLLDHDGDARGLNSAGVIKQISAGTKSLSKEFGCPVLEASQVKRECETRPDKRPLMSDLAESSSIENDAFGVMMLYREDYYRDGGTPDGKAEVIVRKIRQGGKTGRVFTRFHGPSTKFFDPPDEWEDDYEERRYGT